MTRLILVLLGFLAFAAASPAQAQSCGFSVTAVPFGAVDTLSGSADSTGAGVIISCAGAPFGAQARACLNINAGSGGASGATRLMRNAANAPLQFQLYQDVGFSVPFGSVEQTQFGQPGAVDLTLPSGGGLVSTTRFFGGLVLASQQTAATGSYSSTFSGAQVRFNYVIYISGAAPACATMTANPLRPTFTVTATVAANCLMTAQNLNFGSNGVLDAAVNANGAVNALCTPGTTFAVGLNGGLSSGTPTARQMTGPGLPIVYGLYRDAARTLPWGDDPGNREPGSGSGAQQTLPVYGRVPAQSTPTPGLYSDTVVATIRY